MEAGEAGSIRRHSERIAVVAVLKMLAPILCQSKLLSDGEPALMIARADVIEDVLFDRWTLVEELLRGKASPPTHDM